MSHKILLIDDDPDTFETLTPYLEKTMGYLVVAAPDGESALDEIIGQSFDLCILSSTLPGISGAETYRRLKTKQPGLEVIFIHGGRTVEHTNDFLHFSPPPERLIGKPLDDIGQLTRLIIGILGPPVP